MARILKADTIDFAAYYEQTKFKAKIKAASLYDEEMLSHFYPPEEAGPPSMFSTKLHDKLHFRPGEVTVWAGYNGARKSMFTGQVALDLCVQRHRVLMASFEMQPHMTLVRMARQAAALAQPRDFELKKFSSWSDDLLWMFDHIGRIGPDDCLGVCRYFAEEMCGQHVFIDNLMMVCKSEEHLDEQKNFITSIVRLAQETNLHVHLVAHARKPSGGGVDKPPSKYDIRGSSTITDQAHNIAMIWARPGEYERAGDTPDAYAVIEKQRNGAYEGLLKLWWDASSFRFCNDFSSEVRPYEFIRKGV